MKRPAASTRAAALVICFVSAAVAVTVQAESDWLLLTIDNDIFVSSDNGYTNGIYYSWADTPANNGAEIGLPARAMHWSLADRDPDTQVYSVRTIGQSIVTPDDISLEDPPRPPDDLPYAGMLFYSDNWIQADARQADRIGVTIGIIGEYSFAESSQKFVHEILNGQEPRGWDTQLKDEIVFQFARARVRRSWESASGRSDLLLAGEATLGTISSSVGVAAMYRYGRRLQQSYATALLGESRAANPLATESGWYVFAGVKAQYLHNQIFLDGNTFDNRGQKPVDYDREMAAITLGTAWSWKNLSLTFAIDDLNVAGNEEPVGNYSRFGSFTVAWRNY